MSVRLVLPHPVPALHLPPRARSPRRVYARGETAVEVAAIDPRDLAPQPEGPRRWPKLAGAFTDGTDLWRPVRVAARPEGDAVAAGAFADMLAAGAVPPLPVLSAIRGTPLAAGWTESAFRKPRPRTSRGDDLRRGRILELDEEGARAAVLRWCASELRVSGGALLLRLRPLAIVSATRQGTNVVLDPGPGPCLYDPPLVAPARVAEAVAVDDPRCVQPAEAIAAIALLPPGARGHDADAAHLAHGLPGTVADALESLRARPGDPDPAQAARIAGLRRLAHLGAMAALPPEGRAGALEAVCLAIDAGIEGRDGSDPARRLADAARRLRALVLPRLIPAPAEPDLDALGGLAP